jgi:hypothetical protein
MRSTGGRSSRVLPNRTRFSSGRCAIAGGTGIQRRESLRPKRPRTATGLSDQSFRGGNADRNATFCDLMIRTGLRLTEQASLTLFEIPDIDTHRAYSPTRLPSAVAKNGSGRRIYIPTTVLGEVWDDIRFGIVNVSQANWPM